MTWDYHDGHNGEPYWTLGHDDATEYLRQSFHEIWWDEGHWLLSYHTIFPRRRRSDQVITEAERDYYLENPEILLMEDAL